MSKGTLSSKQKGYIGLGVMVVLSAATIWGTEPLYKFVDNFGKEAIYTAGTYTGKAEGFGGEVLVNMTVSETSIESMEIIADGETPGIGSNAVEQLPGAILGKQSAQVDGVSGATITSDAIKDAVDQALALARGEEIKAATEAVTEKETAEESTEVAEAETMTPAKLSFVPGTYTATAQGYGGEVKVEVTVSETAISSIKADGGDETPEIGGEAIGKLTKKMLEAQSSEVDAVSGATITSGAVKEAVKAALAQAEGSGAGEVTSSELSFTPGAYTGSAQGYGGEVKAEVVVSAGSIDEIILNGTDETPEIGGEALKKLSKKMLEAQSADVDGVSGATLTSDAVKNAVKNALSQASAAGGAVLAEGGENHFTPGTYTGIGVGYNSKVTVEVTVSESKIDDVKVKSEDETPEIGGNAVKKLPAKILEAQSPDVDAVSGATITSNAIMDAVKEALNQARS